MTYYTNCPKCKTKLEWRKHEKFKKDMLKKAYMFKKWQVCPHCSYVKHYDEFKAPVSEILESFNVNQSLFETGKSVKKKHDRERNLREFERKNKVGQFSLIHNKQ